MVNENPAVPVQSGPDNLTSVLRVLQFGWMLAEYHGRYAQWSKQPHSVSAAESPQLPPLALPLTDERSAYEQAIQIEGIVVTLAHRLGLDFAYADLSDPPGDDTSAVCQHIVGLRKQLLLPMGDNASSGPDSPQSRPAVWEPFFQLLHDWDARIQDVLAAQSLNQAGGYQLGRGLAEIWWAGSLDSRDASMYPWDWLLGHERCTALDLRLGRLNQYFAPDVAAAMRASLSAWAEVAATKEDRLGPDTMSQLYKQVRIWRDLLLNSYDPENLLSFNTLMDSYNRFKFRRIAGVFLPELLVSGASLIILVPAIAWFTTSPGSAPIVAPIFSVLGVFGLTFAAVTAKAKSAANDLAAQLRETLHRELLAYQITVLPAREKVNRPTRDTSRETGSAKSKLWQSLARR